MKANELVKLLFDCGYKKYPESCEGDAYYCYLCLAQKWLREEKLYNVLIDTGGYKNYEYFIDYHGVHTGPNYPFHEYNHDLICKTYEEALEAGIKKALELILDKGE